MQYQFVYLFMFIVVAVSASGGMEPFETYLRRNIPSGHTLPSFVETCEACGALYGNDYTYKCLVDKSSITFKACFIAVNNKR